MESSNSQIQQAQLIALWKGLLNQGQQPLALDMVHFRELSQNGEDGILLYVFTAIGTTNKKVLEICAGDGKMCNAANLIVNHGWDGYLFDGNEEKVEAGKAFYKQCHDTHFWPPKFNCAWITRDNVNSLLTPLGLAGEIDLLSLDIDGNDYWIFEALDVVQPRVVIAEYQQAWGPDVAVTQRYEADFSAQAYQREKKGPVYVGASLLALVRLAKKKGYRLIGVERKCFNAIFMRDDVGQEFFPAIEPSVCFDHVMARYNMAWMPTRVDPEDPFWVYV